MAVFEKIGLLDAVMRPGPTQECRLTGESRARADSGEFRERLISILMETDVSCVGPCLDIDSASLVNHSYDVASVLSAGMSDGWLRQGLDLQLAVAELLGPVIFDVVAHGSTSAQFCTRIVADFLRNRA